MSEDNIKPKRIGRNPKRCKDCGVLLDYRNSSGYCKKHSSAHKLEPRYCQNGCGKRLISSQKRFCSKECQKEYRENKKTELRKEYLKSLNYCAICDKRLINSNSSMKFCHDCKTKFKTIIRKNTYSIDILRLYVQGNYKICRVHRIFYQTECPICKKSL